MGLGEVSRFLLATVKSITNTRLCYTLFAPLRGIKSADEITEGIGATRKFSWNHP